MGFVFIGVGGGGWVGLVLGVVVWGSYFPPELCYFSLWKTRCEGEEVVPSLQKLFSMLAVGKAVQMTVWSWDSAIRKQGATEEVKKLSWGPEENAQGLLLFLVCEWNKTAWKWKACKLTKNRGDWCMKPCYSFWQLSFLSCFCYNKKLKSLFLTLKTQKFELSRDSFTTELWPTWGLVTVTSVYKVMLSSGHRGSFFCKSGIWKVRRNSLKDCPWKQVFIKRWNRSDY